MGGEGGAATGWLEHPEPGGPAPCTPLSGSGHLSALSLPLPRPCSSVLPHISARPQNTAHPGPHCPRLAWSLGSVKVSVPGAHPSQGTCPSAPRPPVPAPCASRSRPHRPRPSPVPLSAEEQVCWLLPPALPHGPQLLALGWRAPGLAARAPEPSEQMRVVCKQGQLSALHRPGRRGEPGPWACLPHAAQPHHPASSLRWALCAPQPWGRLLGLGP